MPRVVRHKILEGARKHRIEIARVSLEFGTLQHVAAQRPRDVHVLRPNEHHVVTVQQLPCEDGRKFYKR